ncbi:PfkB family carbohydrate kinase [Neoroseomonas oryzicola]|mgnify:CR=1 FL=1|uniref:Sugar kinase n=1 Tax=Neoroseomonas oryzicola TaxID=535904 RepID=A0A9X9WIH7_9PROT|nr:PfkB family carbohydrate kinase [Neoroseomonas oryzicola]MBR0660137.1 sugar kinase [Neoroseomonas oryzicola]NKE19388.1 sugar kinase [Neoroseomonas oryzicola]
MSAPPLVICLGNVVADHTFRVEDIPQPPAKIAARSYSIGPGGMAANAAIAVVRLGGRAAFWGRVGDDLNGEPLAQALEQEGVDVTGLRRVPGGRTPVGAVLVDPRGERTIVSFRGTGLGIDPAWLPLDRIAGAAALCCDPRWPEGVAAAAAAARAAGVPVVLDGERSETRILVDLVPRVDHAIFSVPGLANYAPGRSPEEGLRQALASGPVKVAAVTQGEKGVLWMLPGEEKPTRTPAFPVEATNTTGAGDVFHGAYALAIAEAMPVERAMRFAAAAGALRARDGATPTRAMVDELM